MSLTPGTLCNILRALGFSRMNASYHKMLTALFTSVLIQPAIDTIRTKLSQDKDHQQRTFMTIHQIINLLEFCLRNIYFVFQGRYYEQLEGSAIDSPISPIVANLYMEEFEAKTLSTAPHPQVCGKGLLMTLLLSSNQHTRMNFSNTSIPQIRAYSSLLKTPKQMVLCPF